MSYDMKKSGIYIQKLRIKHGYKQDKLAKALNIDQGFLSRIESGKKGCSVDLFVQLAELFQVSLDALILGKEQTNLLKENNYVQLKTDVEKLIDQLTKFSTQL